MMQVGNKLDAGEELTNIEIEEARTFFNGLLRFFENLHLQEQLGVLDEEIWKSNLITILNMCRGNNASYSYIFPNGITNSSYRESFRELINPPCEE